MAARATTWMGARRRGNPRRRFMDELMQEKIRLGGLVVTRATAAVVMRKIADSRTELTKQQKARMVDMFTMQIGKAPVPEDTPLDARSPEEYWRITGEENPVRVLADYPDLQTGKVGNPLPPDYHRVERDWFPGAGIAVGSTRERPYMRWAGSAQVAEEEAQALANELDIPMYVVFLANGLTQYAGVVSSHMVIPQHTKSGHRKRNYPRSRYWHAVADDRGVQSVAYTGTMGAAQRAGKRLESKGYRALVMPADKDDPRGWRKEWRMGLKNPATLGPKVPDPPDGGRYTEFARRDFVPHDEQEFRDYVAYHWNRNLWVRTGGETYESYLEKVRPYWEEMKSSPKRGNPLFDLGKEWRMGHKNTRWRGVRPAEDREPKLEHVYPSFRVWLQEIAARAGKTVEEVYGKWREYARTCQAHDQSPVQSEFLNWYEGWLEGRENPRRGGMLDPTASSYDRGHAMGRADMGESASGGGDYERIAADPERLLRLGRELATKSYYVKTGEPLGISDVSSFAEGYRDGFRSKIPEHKAWLMKRRGNPDSSGVKLVLGIKGTGANRKSEVQSVLVPMAGYTEHQAASWVKEHGFKATGLNVETYGEYYRFRQERPGKYRTFATIDAGSRSPNPGWMTALQYSSTTRSEAEARQELGGLKLQDGYLGGRVLPPQYPELDRWRVQALFQDEPEYQEGSLQGMKRVKVPPGMWSQLERKGNPPGDIQDRLSSQLADHLWPRVKDVESKGELHEEIHTAMHQVGDGSGEGIGRVGNPVDWEKSIKEFGAGLATTGRGFGSTIQSARARLKKWLHEVSQGDDRHKGDVYYYRAAIAWHEHLKGKRGDPRTEIEEAVEYLKSKHGALWNPQGNPADPSSASLFESFHGTPSTSVSTVTEAEEYPDNLATLGQLVELKVATVSNLEATIQFDGDAPTLASSPDGRQLYIVGGDQSLDLSALKMSGKKWERDSMVLGVLDEFTYRTEKGLDNFKLSDYYHHAGEESGVQPMLVYDNINHRMSIVGGQYHVAAAGVLN